MAFDAFLKIDGIEGESRSAKHAGAIDVLSYSFGVQNTAPAAGGGGGGAGKAEFTDLSVVVPQSSASIPLMLAAATGEHAPSATLSLTRAGDEVQEAYYEIELSDVRVTSVHEAASTGDSRSTNAVSLGFIKWRAAYRTVRPDGSLGRTVEGGYDLGSGSRT